MIPITRAIAVAMVFAGPPALAAEQTPPSPANAPHETVSAKEKNETKAPQVKSNQEGAAPARCTCERAGSRKRERPLQDFGGETGHWPVN
jgi:hypothetical protein